MGQPFGRAVACVACVAVAATVRQLGRKLLQVSLLLNCVVYFRAGGALNVSHCLAVSHPSQAPVACVVVTSTPRHPTPPVTRNGHNAAVTCNGFRDGGNRSCLTRVRYQTKH
jgi:hypothetical protein